jgi:hypothetical protein
LISLLVDVRKPKLILYTQNLMSFQISHNADVNSIHRKQTEEMKYTELLTLVSKKTET